ncbi:hypothetical protein B484DRAFT_118848 [Ochromonadaceae sp. CCMP2298]|nr:hypothetical protein B484DRAFT_118848 [Ochromonadaceae sp. CCMP2298]
MATIGDSPDSLAAVEERATGDVGAGRIEADTDINTETRAITGNKDTAPSCSFKTIYAEAGAEEEEIEMDTDAEEEGGGEEGGSGGIDAAANNEGTDADASASVSGDNHTGGAEAMQKRVPVRVPMQVRAPRGSGALSFTSWRSRGRGSTRVRATSSAGFLGNWGRL